MYRGGGVVNATTKEEGSMNQVPGFSPLLPASRRTGRGHGMPDGGSPPHEADDIPRRELDVNFDRVEAAYGRTDLFERRRVLMKEWSGFVSRSAERSDRRGDGRA